MELSSSAQWRAQIRAIAQYLRTIRPIVQRAATEHAAWAGFLATVVSPSSRTLSPERARRAAGFALTFAGLRGQLKRQVPPSSCAAVHEVSLAWLEVLDLLATAVPAAMQSGAVADLRAIGREASEAQLRLRTFQRTYANTITSLKQMFAARPRISPRPRRPVVKTAAPPPSPIYLPPWRRRRAVAHR